MSEQVVDVGNGRIREQVESKKGPKGVQLIKLLWFIQRNFKRIGESGVRLRFGR